MPDAASPRLRSPRAAKVLSAEAARAKILAKLEKAGAKGAAALYPAKVSEPDRATYTAELSALETSEVVFVDRRKPKQKYFAWSARPHPPSAESVAEALAAWGAQRFPSLLAEADFKKSLGKDREQAALLAPALALLLTQRRLVLLTHRSGKKEMRLYVAAEPLRELLRGDSHESADLPADLPAAYAAVAARTGFPAVSLSDLLSESGAELPTLHHWLLGEHHAGRAVLSLGDWSLATGAERAAALELAGERYLRARLLS